MELIRDFNDCYEGYETVADGCIIDCSCVTDFCLTKCSIVHGCFIGE